MGTALRSISMRIRSVNEETEELDEELSNITGDLINLTKTANNPNGVSVFKPGSTTEFKSLVDYLREVSEIWGDMTEVQQNNFLQKAFAKTQAAAGAAILQNFDQVDKALETMENAAGSADREMSIIQDSLDYKINALKETWVGTFQQLIDRGTVGGVIDFLTLLSEGIGNVITDVGLLNTAFMGLGAVFGSKFNLFRYDKSKGLSFGLGSILGKSISHHKDKNQLSTIKEYFQGIQDDNISAFVQEDVFKDLFDGVDNVTDKVKEMWSAWSEGGKSTKDAIDDIDIEIGELSKDTGGLIGSLKNLGGSLLSMGLNMLISFGVSKGIEFISGAIDKYIVTAKEAEKTSNDFSNAVSEMSKSQQEFGTRLSGYEEEFKNLSKGVNSLGENISLTNDEFQRYREISDDIAKNMPSAVDLWNSQGEAVINLKNGVRDLTDEYQKYIQAQARALLDKEDEDGLAYTEATIKNANNTLGRTSIDNGYEYQTISLNEEISRMKSLASKSYDEIQEIFKYGDAFEISWLKDAGFTYDTTEDEFVQSVHSALEAQIDAVEADIDNASFKISQLASTYAQSLPRYWSDLGDESRKYVDLFLNNIDYDFIDTHFRDSTGKISGDLINKYVTNLITAFDNLSDEDLKQITLRFDLETQFNNGEITSVGDYLAKLAEIDSWISTLPEETQKIIRILFDVGGEDSINELREDTLKRMGGSSSRGSDFKRSGSKQILDFIDDMSADELSIWNAALHDGKIPQDILAAGRESWDKYLKTLQQDAEDNPLEIEIKASSAVDSMADAKTAFNSLDSLYDQVVNMNAANGQATGFADPSLMNSVESAFSKFVDSSGDTEQLNNALESFEKTLVEVPNDYEAAQRAIDNLTTAYVDQTDIIKNLDDANAEWSVEQLKAMGITNAEQVVFSRLSEKAKKTAENLKLLSKAVKDNRKELDKAVSEGDASAEAFDNISDSVKNLLASYDEEGNIVLPEIDNQFILDNFADIEAAIAGDIDAINRLRVEAAKGISVNVKLQDQSFFDASNELLSMIAQLDANDFTVDGYMNNADVLNKLAEMNAAFKGTAVEFARYISQITGGAIQAKVEYETIDVGNMTGYEAAQKMGYSGNAATQFASAVDRGAVTKLRIPKVVNYEWTGSSLGAGANYRPSVGGDTGKGGSGDDGSSKSSEPNKPKEEAAETFDWIEVKLKRLEEAQQRLDRVVNNTYTTWSDRNKSLNKELSNIEKQIKNNENAEKHYKKYAEKNVKINNGKDKVNPDDYGENDSLVMEADQKALDEAIKIWEQHTYQDLVQKGKIGKDDIEKISNKFLKEAISEYTQWWEKGIAAGEKAKDKAIEYLDKIKQRFEMVKTRYEQLVTLIQDKADIIDKKIARTQEKGFFVSNKYYEQLIKNESQQLNVLETERDKLIKERDKALAAGIKKTSEAYRNLEHDINTVNSAIEESKNQTIEWQNTMRQNNWDKFDWLEERISRIKTEAQGLIDLLSNDKLYEDDGRLTDKGMATTGLYAIQWQTNQRQIAHYTTELRKLEDELKANPSDKNLISRYLEVADATNELVKSNDELENSYQSLVQEGVFYTPQYLKEILKNLFNCWETLKAIRLQRKNEIYLSVNA